MGLRCLGNTTFDEEKKKMDEKQTEATVKVDTVALVMRRVADEMIPAVQQEFSALRAHVYELERRISRYDQAFETMFKCELDARINGKDQAQAQMTTGSSGKLEKLYYDYQNKAREAAIGGALKGGGY